MKGVSRRITLMLEFPWCDQSSHIAGSIYLHNWGRGVGSCCLFWLVPCLVDQSHCITKTQSNQIQSNQVNARHLNTRRKSKSSISVPLFPRWQWLNIPTHGPQPKGYRQALDTQSPAYHCTALLQVMGWHFEPPYFVLTRKNCWQLRCFYVLAHSFKPSVWTVDMLLVYS